MYKRSNAWSLQEKLMGIFRERVVEPDLEWIFIDGSIEKAHQHSSGAAYGQETAIGKSVAGNTTKIHMAGDAYGLPIHFSVTGGEVHDCKEAPALVAKLPLAHYTIADKGYDSEPLWIQIREKGSVPIIPRKQNSTIGNDEMDWRLYKYRHHVKNVFARLKHFRAIAHGMTNCNAIMKVSLLWPVLLFGYPCETATATRLHIVVIALRFKF